MVKQISSNDQTMLKDESVELVVVNMMEEVIGKVGEILSVDEKMDIDDSSSCLEKNRFFSPSITNDHDDDLKHNDSFDPVDVKPTSFFHDEIETNVDECLISSNNQLDDESNLNEPFDNSCLLNYDSTTFISDSSLIENNTSEEAVLLECSDQ